MSETDLVVQDLLEERYDDMYIEESNDDENLRTQEMDNDDELTKIMNFVFDFESEEDE